MGMKEMYQEKARAQLKEWQGWIEQYRSTVGAVSADLRENQRKVERMENCYRIACVRMDELHRSQGEQWELAKQAVERAMIDLKRALDEDGARSAARLVHIQKSRAHVYEPFEKKGNT